MRQRVAEIIADLLIEAVGAVNCYTARLVNREQVFVLEDHIVPEFTTASGRGRVLSVGTMAIAGVEERLIDLKLISVDDSVSTGDLAAVYAHPPLANNREDLSEGSLRKHSPKHSIKTATVIVLAGLDRAICRSHEEVR